VNAQGAAAIPVHDGSGALRAVVDIAFAIDRDFTREELDELTRSSAALPRDD
jgi:hypothetical protein